jgi:hypothetical protein
MKNLLKLAFNKSAARPRRVVGPNLLVVNGVQNIPSSKNKWTEVKHNRGTNWMKKTA